MGEHSQVKEKKEQQPKKKDHEKTDDKLPLLDITAGKVIGIDIVCEARRLLTRPFIKEIMDRCVGDHQEPAAKCSGFGRLCLD